MTLTLIAFLVVLLVGLSAYTRIETAVAGNTQRQAQARQNALLGLNVALGQLQSYTGRDQRVTATGEATGGANAHYTGVWSSDPTVAPSTAPLTWLVSGSETPANPSLAPVQLVGPQTAGTGNSAAFVTAPLVNLKSYGVPGQTANDTPATGGTTIGHYAWWVGDQGVKASVALADPTNTNPILTSSVYHYSPYSDFPDLLSRIRQQISLGAGAFDTSANTPVFEPRDTNNAPLVANGKVSAFNQIAFLKNSASPPAAIGFATLQNNFHTWSPNNFAVLANTKLGGLRQDLSVDSSLLGAAVQGWLNFAAYMEPPASAASSAFPPSPKFSADPLRRRFVMQLGPPSIAPVLAYFLLSFNIRTQGGSAASRPIEARAFWKLALWNPYSSALVPESIIRVEVTGLPNVRVDDDTHGASVAGFSLQTLYGSGGSNSPLKIILPWDSTPPSGVSGDDRRSWLPGRVYNWRSIEETTGVVPSNGYPSRFYAKSYTAPGESNGGVIRPASPVLVDGNDRCHIDGDAQTIRVKLIAVRSSGDIELANFTSPQFTSFTTNSRELQMSSTQFVYFFRLAETADNPAWLQTAGVDPHEPPLGSTAFAYGPNVDSPSAYAEDYEDSTFADRLLDRATNSFSYDEDVPVFELPRSPVLSLGSLQHVALAGQRPFAIGNSWGATATLGSTTALQVFDQFFLSGLEAGVTPATVSAALVLPNPLLKPLLRNSATGTTVAFADLQGALNAQSSKFLLQGGSFNLNSTNAAAWSAVLRSVRLLASTPLKFHDVGFDAGTAGDGTTKNLPRASTDTDSQQTDPLAGDALFFRFSQSAQETYKADDPKGGVTYAASTVPPPADPNPPSTANTHLFRVGIHKVSSGQVSVLATAIANAIKAHQAASGPFRSLEEFLSPVSAGNPSLIEQAIIDADAAGAHINIDANGNPIEFSSQFLTQADIMTALAPALFPRSDTFVIRSYGEAVNPTTGATEGKAWCEATVQRVPDYFNAAADDATTAPAALTDPTNLNQTLGRRFKIVSFRWLTRSDI